MKKLYTLTISLILILRLANAQVPQGFKYQTAIRDNNGAVLANKLVAIKLSLLTGSASGTAVYSEVHKVATNDFGVANLNVGNGTASLGNFNTIDWGSNTFFLKTEVDVNNGTNYTFMGSSQLLSVPFAIYAAKSANAADDKDKDSTNELQTISLYNNNLQLNKNGGSVDLTKYTIDNNTDSQTISLTGNNLAITRGNFVKLNDIDSTNELQQLTLNNNNLQLNKNGGSVDLAKYDKDSQQLVLNGNTLSITKGNSIILSSAVDLDSDPTNEIQNISFSKDTLKLSQANFVVLPKDNDADSTNEIQSLLYRNDTLQISKSNQVVFLKDNDRDSINELQGIQQSGNTVSLSKNGGNIKVPSLSNIQNGSILYANASGTNNFLLNLQDTISAYVTGMTINFKVPNSNTGHVTVNVNNLGVKPLFKNVSDTMESDDLLQNKMLSIIYDGQRFQLLNQLQNNYPKFDFAHFVLDSIYSSTNFQFNNSNDIGPPFNTWLNLIKFNKTTNLSGSSIARSGDTIILKKGIYKIKCEVPVSISNGRMDFRRIRLRNITNNTTIIQGNGLFPHVNSNSSLSMSWDNLMFEGYIEVLNESNFLVQIIAAYYTSIGTLFDPNNPSNTVSNSIFIEKIR